MIVRHEIKEAFKLKGGLVIPDALGVEVSNQLVPNSPIRGVFHSPEGEEYEISGKIAFELIHHKNEDSYKKQKLGGSIIFEELPNKVLPKGWVLYVHIDQL